MPPCHALNFFLQATRKRNHTPTKPFPCFSLRGNNNKLTQRDKKDPRHSFEQLIAYRSVLSPPPLLPSIIMSNEPPIPSPSTAAAATAAATTAGADFNIIVPSTGPNATLEQRQLAEFNQWVNRYNNYQHQLEAYWRGRLQAETATRGDGTTVALESKKGSINKGKWFRRYEELVSVWSVLY